jgi:hypothetical protein
MKLLRDPMLHFVLLGVVLFGAYYLVSGVISSGEERRIEIGDAEIEFLAGNFERQWGRPPTDQELQNLLDARIREEVLYREALAVGLDRNDVVVRRRMVQKMELLTQDLALLADPTDAELQKFFEENAENYRIPPVLDFSHIYFNAERRPDVEEDARRVLDGLRAQNPPPRRAPERGDTIMLDADYRRVTPAEVSRLFGDRFAEALFELTPGWHGPVVSGYGLHLVHVGERVEGRIPEYTDVRERLVNDFNRQRRDRAMEALYEGLAEQYEIAIVQKAE